MGWVSDKHPDHEGSVVALVTRDGVSRGYGIYRSLGYPTDDHNREIEKVAAECTCGWRSPHWSPRAEWLGEDGKRREPSWRPFIALVSKDDEDRALDHWTSHIDALPAGR